jgi:eukaryotic-like serine/threonine-protein kinase
MLADRAVPSNPQIEPQGLPRVGEVFAGKYLIVRVLGEGGMGIVYEAVHQRLDLKVAIKTLLPLLMGQPDLVDRFDREGRAAARLKNRHIAHTMDVDVSDDGLPYMVMEYLEGIDLDVDLQNRGTLPIAESVEYVLQACEAMNEAHGLGIVHRDLKPANFFICTINGERVLKVLDFGISKTAGETGRRLTNTEVTLGTPVYMSPEQVRGTKDLDHRSDIWSLGVILYELLAGEPPFDGSATAAAVAIATEPVPPLTSKRPGVPPELQAAIERALSKNPEDRFPDVASFATAIAPFAPQRRAWPSDPELSLHVSVPSIPGVVRSLASEEDFNEWSVSSERAETLDAAALLRAETLPAATGRSRRGWSVGVGVAALALFLLSAHASVRPAARAKAGQAAVASRARDDSSVVENAPSAVAPGTYEDVPAVELRMEATAEPQPGRGRHAAHASSAPLPLPAPPPPARTASANARASSALTHPLYLP